MKKIIPHKKGCNCFRCSGIAWNKGLKGVQAREKHPRWSGGRTVRKDGYVFLNLEDGRRMLEHRYLMEKLLHRKLNRHETVHHRDGNRRNNELENLELIDNSNHVKIHLAERWTNWNPKCKICGCRALAKFLCKKHYLREWRSVHIYA